MNRLFTLVFISLLVISSTSCLETKNISYFNNAVDTTYAENIDDREIIIQPNDILSISIGSLNAEASAVFNTSNNYVISASTASGSNTQMSGYLVNTDGTIQLPILGNIKAAGLSKKDLKEKITNIIIEKKLLIDPIVNIRHMNFEVTVIGEVGHPTVITVPSEKISMLKALGLAGDITIYGKKENVLLIRENNGKKKVSHVDLNSPKFLNSPYYYLKPNDVVYVEPNKNKIASVERGRQILPAILSGLSVIVIVVDRIIR
jgi:polysaccharide export outer membrane protein